MDGILVRLSNASVQERPIILGPLAVISALLSNFAWYNSILRVDALVFWGVPLLPGVFFGIVLSLAIWLWVSHRPFEIFAILLSTIIAWIAAAKTALYAFGSIEQMLAEIAAPGTYFPTINFMSAVCGVLGGLVGSTTLTFALSFICREFGTFENWARIVIPGTILGILLELAPTDNKLVLHIGSLLPLFLAWQMAVASLIGYCIVPRGPHGKPPPSVS